MRSIEARRHWTFGALALATAMAVGCSVNPATGKRQVNIIGEQQEIAIGKENDAQIVAAMGLYDDPEVQAYVQRLGEELAAESERPHLPWTFRVLDDPIVNAFALPGGYIYVTRGILTHLNDEAELVGVLGHEIGHVTARHGVNRLSKAQLMSVGLGVGMILSPELAQLGDVAQSALSLLFLKYSRDDERQADDLGLRYSIRGGWDARRMPGVFDVLRRVGDASGGSRAPSWLATHPDPERRSERIREQIAATGVDFSGFRVNRADYFGYLDGMVFGANPRNGYFEEALFLHPDLRFQLSFPAGWPTRNQRNSVDGISPQQDALVQLTLAQESTPAEALRAFVEGNKLNVLRGQRGEIGGFPASGAEFTVSNGQTILRGQAAFVRYGDITYRLLGYTSDDKWGSYAAPIGGYINSFRQLTDRAVLGVQPARLEIVNLRRELPLDAFQRRYPSSVPLETVALINNVDSGGRLAGQSKRVIGGPGS